MYKDATMWVGSNDYGIASSLYYFGADGKMSVPDFENGKKAIVEKDGKLYITTFRITVSLRQIRLLGSIRKMALSPKKAIGMPLTKAASLLRQAL